MKVDNMNERLRNYMDDQGLSAKDFAQKLGVQPSAISHILSGRNKPSVEFLQKLLHAFPEVDLNYLISGMRSTLKASSALKDVQEDEDSAPSPTITEKVILLKADGSFKEYVPG